MSTLWTPSGEHRVDRPKKTSTEKSQEANVDDAIAAALPDGVTLEDLSDEERANAEAIIKKMAQARERMLQTPAATIVANHAMGLYELAALHLSTETPNFAEASIAIDALNAIVEKMVGRLGEGEATVVNARDQIRVAFVRLKQQTQTQSQSSDNGQ